MAPLIIRNRCVCVCEWEGGKYKMLQNNCRVKNKTKTGVSEKKTVEKNQQPKMTTTIPQKNRVLFSLMWALEHRRKLGKTITVISQSSLTSIYDFVKQAAFTDENLF